MRVKTREMNRILTSAIAGAILLVSCRSTAENKIFTPSETAGKAETAEAYTITDYKNKSSGALIPAWVNSYLDGGVREVETLDAYEGFYVFIGRSEGTNFNALRHWSEGFLAELDFPRIAAARVEARFSSGAPRPDDAYGSFYEALVLAASDASWAGARREDDFWIRKKYEPAEDEEDAAGGRETWEFLILVIMEKSLFSFQLDEIFTALEFSPRPSKDQIAAANRVKEHFFDGF